MDDKVAVLEGLLFIVGDDGLTIDQIKDLLDINQDDVREVIGLLKNEYNKPNRGINLSFLGNTFKLTTKKEHKPYYEKLLINKENNSLSNSALETLAIIAYNEPITRIAVDELRGVQTGQLMRKLVAKGLIKEVGRSDLPGRPILYKTTNEFLDYFGINDVKELPKVIIEDKKKNETDLYSSKYTEEIIE